MYVLVYRLVYECEVTSHVCLCTLTGKRRVKSKRALDYAAQAAVRSVDPEELDVKDVRELAKRIQYALEEPITTDYPPDEVLHLVRLCAMVLQAARGHLGISEYSFIQVRYYHEVDGELLNWRQSSMLLMRSDRFIRLVRAMAHGAAAKPPRLITLPQSVNILYAAQLQNEHWQLETFEELGMGSKVCCKLFIWLRSILEVATRQAEFSSFISSSFPDWLPKLYGLQVRICICKLLGR